MNVITRQHLAQKLIDYLHNRLTLAELVDWAEEAMMEGNFADEDYDTLHDIITRLGLADVRAFGLTWEDYQNYLSRLGYQAQVTVLEAN